MKIEYTYRGFGIYKFQDINGNKCHLQKSSLATEDCIWLGLDSADPKIMARDSEKIGIPVSQDTGWVDFKIPEEVLLSTTMHISQKQANDIIEILQRFVDTGEIYP